MSLKDKESKKRDFNDIIHLYFELKNGYIKFIMSLRRLKLKSLQILYLVVIYTFSAKTRQKF